MSIQKIFSTAKSTIGGINTKIKSNQASDTGKSIASTAGEIFNTIADNKADPSDTSRQQQNAVKSKVTGELIKSGNPLVMSIGVAASALDAIGAATGFQNDNIDKEAGSRFGIKGGFNNVMGYIPGMSLVGGAISKDTISSDNIMQETRDIYGAYADAGMDLDAAQKLGGKRIIGRRKRNQINDVVEAANDLNNTMYNISTTNTYKKQSDYGNDIMQQNLNRYAGSNYMGNQIGRLGMKLISVGEAKKILALRQQISDIQAFANGGQINVIPEGARHSRLNHLEDAHDNLSDVTKKGIPVVTPTEDGDLEQVAEIERTELVINLELTNKIEDLRKKWKDTNDAKYLIEAGKLLAKDIVTNTIDPGNQVDEFLCPKKD